MTQFTAKANFKHTDPRAVGILLVNLGTPDEPTPKALRRYLAEFLSDPRVIELNRLGWWLILNLFVLPFRPKRVAKLYKGIWTKEGSPLLVTSQRQRDLLRDLIKDQFSSPIKVALGMRYGNPSVSSALSELREQGVDHLLVVPMYPQYAGATTGSTFDAVSDVLKKWRWVPSLRFVGHYHDHPMYIEALAKRIEDHWSKAGRAEKLLLSFHGIPKRYFSDGDPYYCHCQKTARLLAERLGLMKDQFLVSFQSRFGPEEWLKPYTDKLLEKLAQDGLKTIDVACPGFTADCLETIEEIGEENREAFIEAGGEALNYIPAVNDHPDFIKALLDVCASNLGGWAGADYDAEQVHRELELSAKRAEEIGSLPNQS